jgi:hypothetical protein
VPGTTPIKKNGDTHKIDKGMTPITKNINVIDEKGNIYEATFPKRAKGLVKKGRARFVNNNTICLTAESIEADPAGNTNPENIMDNNITQNDNINNTKKLTDSEFVREQIDRMMNLLESKNPGGEPYFIVQTDLFDKVRSMLLSFMDMTSSNNYDDVPAEPSIKYVMSRIDRIIRENEHIKNALNSIQTMKLNECPNGGTGDAARAQAIQSTVQSRETTNQKILDLLDKMYDDLKPRQPDIKEAMFRNIIEATAGAGPFTDERANLIEKYIDLLDSLRHIND